MNLEENGVAISLNFADKETFKDFYYRSSR